MKKSLKRKPTEKSDGFFAACGIPPEQVIKYQALQVLAYAAGISNPNFQKIVTDQIKGAA